MGIDVKVHLNPEFEVEHVVDFLESIGAGDVTVKPADFCTTFFVISFQYNEEARQMNFHHRLGIFNSNIVTLGKWGSAEDILTQMVERFGGVYIPNDCEDRAIVYDQPAYNNMNALYVHKWALARGLVDGSDIEDMVKANGEFKNYLRRN